MTKRIWKNLLKWQNYAHYAVLGLAVAVLLKVLGVDGLLGQYYLPTELFWIFLAGVFVFDTLIHFVFSVLPVPYRWED